MALLTPATAQKALQSTLQRLEKTTPGFRSKWMLWGTSAIAADIIRPKTGVPLVSIDLDFRSRSVSAPIRDELSGIKRAFPKHKVHEADIEFGILRTGIKDQETGLPISIDLMSSDEETASETPEASASFANFPRQSLKGYTRNKIACLTERLEEKDLLHLFLLSQTSPQLKKEIESGIRKIPLLTLTAHQEALNKNWDSLTKNCIWGELPTTSQLASLNTWLRVIALQIANSTLRPSHDQNRHTKSR